MNKIPNFNGGRTYTVIGRGDFPHDMLRRDDAQFATQADSDAAGEGYVHDRRAVRLVLTDTSARGAPNVARWESFGWLVARDERDRKAAPTMLEVMLDQAAARQSKAAAQARRDDAARAIAEYFAQLQHGTGHDHPMQRGDGLSRTAFDNYALVPVPMLHELCAAMAVECKP